jgi:hypothetical protein
MMNNMIDNFAKTTTPRRRFVFRILVYIMVAGDQFPLPPSVASFAIDHPSKGYLLLLLFSIRRGIIWVPVVYSVHVSVRNAHALVRTSLDSRYEYQQLDPIHLLSLQYSTPLEE